MKQREIGRSNVKVSEVGLGCNNFGLLIDASASSKVIGRALDLGVTFFDTADVYGDSELILGQCLGNRRKEVVVATKFGMVGEGLAGGASRRYIMEAAARSLRRLDTDYIDVFYLHCPDPSVPIEETLRALQDLIDQGKVRHAAASKATTELLTEAASISAASDVCAFIATQEQYNLLARGVEQSLLATVQSLGLGIIPYSPLANGLLTGKYGRGMVAEGTRFSVWKQLATSLLTHGNLEKVDRLSQFASVRGRVVGELAIAWLLTKESVPSVIAGATSAAQLEANVCAATWALSSDEITEVERIVH